MKEDIGINKKVENMTDAEKDWYYFKYVHLLQSFVYCLPMVRTVSTDNLQSVVILGMNDFVHELSYHMC